ncbi:hypothetical protein [Bradyrhizobium diazoefficiens]
MKSISKRAAGADAIKELSAAVAAATPDTYMLRFQKKDGSAITDNGRVPVVEYAAMVALQVDAAGGTRGALGWENDIRSKAIDRFPSKLPPKVDEALTNFITSTR